MIVDSVRILLADDHPMFRHGLRSLLSSLDDIEVVGDAATGTEAVTYAESLQPDVVIMDLHMPDLNGIEATRRILRHSPHIGVLVLTMYEDDDSVFAAMRAGARGYLLKGAAQQEVVRAVEAVASGEAIFGPTIAERIAEYLTAHRSGALPRAFPSLTDREREVLDLIARGLANPAIAAQLSLSEKTIRNHVSNIFAKLQVADRAEAIIRARDAGLGRRLGGISP